MYSPRRFRQQLARYGNANRTRNSPFGLTDRARPVHLCGDPKSRRQTNASQARAPALGITLRRTRHCLADRPASADTCNCSAGQQAVVVAGANDDFGDARCERRAPMTRRQGGSGLDEPELRW